MSECPVCDKKQKSAWLSYIAVSVNVIGYLPLLYQSFKKRDIDGLPWFYLIASFSANIAWMIYGLINKEYGVAAVGIFFMFASASLMIGKCIWGNGSGRYPELAP